MLSSRPASDFETTSMATAFIGPEFTLSELQEVYEATWGEQLEPRDFRRKVLSLEGLLSPTGRHRSPGPDGGKPAEVFTASSAVRRLDQPIRRAAAPTALSTSEPPCKPGPTGTVEMPDRYPNDFGDDPWDNDAVHWLLDQPGVAAEWSRQRLFEALRRREATPRTAGTLTSLAQKPSRTGSVCARSPCPDATAPSPAFNGPTPTHPTIPMTKPNVEQAIRSWRASRDTGSASIWTVARRMSASTAMGHLLVQIPRLLFASVVQPQGVGRHDLCNRPMTVWVHAPGGDL